jgi:hypothetical protein
MSTIYVTSLFSQTLTGTIVDAKTNEPLSFATVYLEGTTIGTTANAQGKFILPVKNHILTKLIVSYLGYESAIIDNPFDEMPEIIYLKEKTYNLDEVAVTANPIFSREEKLKAFREYFLGRTIAGQSCKILNENDLVLVFDNTTNSLNAYAEVPLEIENQYLGYKIKFELAKFSASLKSDKKSLQRENIDVVYFLGIPFFEELKKHKSIYDKRRKEIYAISDKRFFKLLADNQLEKSNFKIYKRPIVYSDYVDDIVYLAADSVFANVTSTDSTLYCFVLNPDVKNIHKQAKLCVITVNESARTIKGASLASLANVTYEPVTYSEMVFTVDTFKVDKYGNTDLYRSKGLLTTGTMGEQRLGDMLPLDYNRFVINNIK